MNYFSKKQNKPAKKQSLAFAPIKAPALTPKNTPLQRLLNMLEFKRPAHSKLGERFCQYFIDEHCEFIDAKRNRIVRIGANPKVLWSSHFDTVHNQEGLQKIVINGDWIKLAHNSNSNCLGADCSTGIWLMLELIRAKKDGLYIFHACEEIGGLGSDYIAKYTPELLQDIDFCIALDRKGQNSIITHQGGWRCCSDIFAQSLASALPQFENLRLDDTGTFTDSANYVDLIPECTNLSVGYESAHSANEKQSISFALDMLEALHALDYSTLTKARVAGESESLYDWQGFGAGFSGGLGAGVDWDDLESFVYANPDIVADYLLANNITPFEIEQFYKPSLLTKGQ